MDYLGYDGCPLVGSGAMSPRKFCIDSGEMKEQSVMLLPYSVDNTHRTGCFFTFGLLGPPNSQGGKGGGANQLQRYPPERTPNHVPLPYRVCSSLLTDIIYALT